jgi:hypothetical protein
MAYLTASDVTVSLDPRDRNKLGKIKMNELSLAFGDGALTYPNGGIPVPAVGNLGLNKQVKNLVIAESSSDGLIYRYDKTNHKLKVYTKAPPIVYEEVVTCTAKVGYLKYPAAHIEYVTDDTDDYRVIPGGLTPITKTVAVDMGFDLTTGVLTRGQRTKLTFFDAVATAKVSYITQAWKEVADNMVQACMTSGVRTYGHAGLAFVAGTPDAVRLGEDFVALQSVIWHDAATTIKPCWPIKTGVDPTTGGGECAPDFRKAATFGEILFKEEDAVDTATDVLYFNYIRDPGAGYFLYDRFTESTLADTVDVLAAFPNYPLIMCVCGGLPAETAAKKILMTGVGDTVAAGEGKITSHPYIVGVTRAVAPIVTMHADTNIDAYTAYIAGDPSEIETVPIELPDGNVIQATTLRCMVWGR